MVAEQVLSGVDLTGYVGQWVVICNDKIVAHNKNLSKLKQDIGKCKTAPTIAKIPKKQTLIF